MKTHKFDFYSYYYCLIVKQRIFSLVCSLGVYRNKRVRAQSCKFMCLTLSLSFSLFRLSLSLSFVHWSVVIYMFSFSRCRGVFLAQTPKSIIQNGKQVLRPQTHYLDLKSVRITRSMRMVCSSSNERNERATIVFGRYTYM